MHQGILVGPQLHYMGVVDPNVLSIEIVSFSFTYFGSFPCLDKLGIGYFLSFPHFYVQSFLALGLVRGFCYFLHFHFLSLTNFSS